MTELTAAQIIWIVKVAFLISIIYMASRIIPAVLEYKKIKYLEVVITTKQCKCNNEPTLFQTFFPESIEVDKEEEKRRNRRGLLEEMGKNGKSERIFK